MMNKQKTSFTLSGQAKDLLGKLALLSGINMTAMLEILIREKAKQEGIISDGNKNI